VRWVPPFFGDIHQTPFGVMTPNTIAICGGIACGGSALSNVLVNFRWNHQKERASFDGSTLRRYTNCLAGIDEQVEKIT